MRSTVRAALVAYMKQGMATTGACPFLSQVYAHPPKLTKTGDFVQGEAPGIASGGIIFVHIIEAAQHRLAGGPPGYDPPNPQPATPARKKKVYTVGFICVLRSTKRDTQDVGADNDSFLDGIEEWVLRDRNAGTASPTNPVGPAGDGSGTIFAWGEGSEIVGEVDIVTKAGMPKTINAGVSQVFSTMDIITLEILST